MTITETSVRIGRADELGMDPEKGKPWVVVCDKHHFTMFVSSRERARALGKDSREFCEDCRDSQEYTQDFVDEVAVAQEPTTKNKLMSTEPVLDTYFNSTGTEVHGAVAISVANSTSYMRTVCKPDVAMLMGQKAAIDDPAMCAYCLAGIEAPTQKKVKEKVKPKTVKEPKVKIVATVVKEPEPEPRHVKYTLDVYDACKELLGQLDQTPSPLDARRGLEILEPVVARLRAMVPRRRTGEQTGVRSGWQSQASTFQPGELFTRIQDFAKQGDVRAQQIVAHAQAYVPGENCRYCLDTYGKEARHQAALAFCSIGRELRAMIARTSAKKS